MNKNYPTKLKILVYIWNNLWIKNTKPQRFLLILSLVFIFITIAIDLSIPFFLKQIFSGLSLPRSKEEKAIILLIIAYGFTWILSKVTEKIREVISFFPVTTSKINFSLELFEHIHKLSYSYHINRKIGNIISAFNRLGGAYKGLIESLFLFTIPVVLEILLALFILGYYYNVLYSITLFMMLFSYIILSYHIPDWIIICRRRQNEADKNSNTFIVDSLLNSETVKIFDTEEYEEKQALKLLKIKEEATVASLMADIKIELIQNLIIGLSIILITLIAGIQIIYQSINISDFILINTYLFMFMRPLDNLVFIVRQVKESFTALELSVEILEEPVEIENKLMSKPLDIKKGVIQFRNVTFQYNNNKIILDKINFEVPAGRTVAIVGPSGAGKSTIARLLFRLYDPTEGEILIDNQNIAEITIDSLQANIGVVPQDSVLFNDTIYNNIRYGNLNCSKQDILEAVYHVQLSDHTDDNLHKLNVVVGERGLKLSGGERQRVAIARMLVKKPKIFIFDESTSSLDTHTEKEIQKNIETLSKGTTTIIIAHRLSTITHADIIIVLNGGKIVEQGTHDYLLGFKGLYSLLWKQQLEEKILQRT